MAHGSCHPCSWCDIEKGLLAQNGIPQTLGNLSVKFWAWFAAGSVAKNAKNYGNIIHLPLLKGSPDEEVIDLLPLPELHLLLGPMNMLFKAMEKVWPNAIEWAKVLNVEHEAMHGGSFNGNSCNILLSNLDTLQAMCSLQCYPFLHCFRVFRVVVKACYGMKLSLDYQSAIQSFKAAFLDLEIPVTPKIHAMFYHIPEFCSRKRSGLGRWSEQAGEAVHSDFKVTWGKYKVGLDNTNYMKNLLIAVQDYNAKHL